MPAEIATVLVCGVIVDCAETSSEEIDDSVAPPSTEAYVPPPTSTRVNDAPTATAPVPNWPVVSSSVRFEIAVTLTEVAFVTLPIVACTTLSSLITATAAPIPTKPPAPSRSMRLTLSFRVAPTVIVLPALSVPSASAETLSETEKIATEAPAPTKPPANWPPMIEKLDCSLAVTAIEWPAIAVPSMIADVPAGVDLALSVSLIFCAVGALASILFAASCTCPCRRFCGVFALPLPSPLTLPKPPPPLPVTVPVALCACVPALLSADLPLPSVAFPVSLPLSSLLLFWICVPTDHTLTAPPTPTKPPAPLASKPLMFFSPTAFTSMSCAAFSVAPDSTFAEVLLFNVPTSTAPETPTKPPAMPSTKVCTLASFAALMKTFWLPCALPVSPFMTAFAPTSATVLELISVTPTAPDTPTKPPAPAATICRTCSLDPACTIRPVPVVVSNAPETI